MNMRMINIVNPWSVHELLPSLNGGHALNQVAHQSPTLDMIIIIMIIKIILIMIIMVMMRARREILMTIDTFHYSHPRPAGYFHIQLRDKNVSLFCPAPILLTSHF